MNGLPIKICLRGFWRNVDGKEFLKRHLELKDFNIIFDDKDPDIVIFSVFSGYKNIPNCPIKVFYTGENVSPVEIFKKIPFQYAMTFDRRKFDDFENFRLPNYVVAGYIENYYMNDFLKIQKLTKIPPNFCCYIHKNNANHRVNFVKELLKYKKVDCPGPSLNNMSVGSIHRNCNNKISFMSKYKFAVCFENAKGNGYVTEKIADALYARTVPIYWGDNMVVKDFSPGCFINGNSFDNFNELIEYIKFVDNDDVVYNSIRNHPRFYTDTLPEEITIETRKKYWEKIFSSIKR